MNKLTTILIAAAVMLSAGLLAFNTEATAMTGAVGIGAKSYTPVVQDIGCRLNGPAVGANGCLRGTHQVCKKKTGCACVPCTH